MVQGKRVFKCDLCSETFRSYRGHHRHKKAHNDLPHSCTACPLRFVKMSDLRQHFKSFHKTTNVVYCEYCAKSFSTIYLLDTHLLRYHWEQTGKEKPQVFECDECNYKTMCKRSYKRHKKSHLHLNEWTCEICGKQFATKNGLKVHRTTHSEIKPFICTYCNKGFTRNDYLKEHIRIHTGERPFRCTICGHGFTQRTPLRVHLKTHIKENNFA